MSKTGEKLDIAILGTGNIGCDLLAKIIKSPNLNCVLFAGRRPDSPGIAYAKSLGIPTSCESIDAIIERNTDFDLVMNASTAQAAKEYAVTLQNLQLRQIDLTPSSMGAACVPIINGNSLLYQNHVNFVSCGAQASIPIVHALMRSQCKIEMMEVIVSACSESVGPGTRDNIDEYLVATEQAIKAFSNAKQAKSILNITKTSTPTNFKVTVLAQLEKYDTARIKKNVDYIANKFHKAIMPDYRVVFGPEVDNGRLVIMLEIAGAGDYLPKHAGNLDIITSNAIYFAESIVQTKLEEQLCA